MNKEFIEAYNNLDTNNKRDKLNHELLVIKELLKETESDLNLDNDVDIYDYNPENDKDWTEDDFLMSTYQDVYNIERELITVVKLLQEKAKSAEKSEMFE